MKQSAGVRKLFSDGGARAAPAPRWRIAAFDSIRQQTRICNAGCPRLIARGTKLEDIREIERIKLRSSGRRIRRCPMPRQHARNLRRPHQADVNAALAYKSDVTRVATLMYART
jgi:hypothetical protein